MRIDLRAVRLDRGETVRSVCRATGLSPAAVRAWERLPDLAPPEGPSLRLAGLAALLAHYGLALAVVPASQPDGPDAAR